MQVVERSFNIQEETKKDCLLEVISDKYCRILLQSTMHKPKSAIELTSETKIPISTIYRRIQMLHDNKLLRTSGAITDDGKKLFMYKSMIKEIQCNFNEGKIDVEITLNK